MKVWKLFLDDDARTSGMESFRYPPDASWTIACSAQEAIYLAKSQGLPSIMDLDHDLGDSDTMQFLRAIEVEFSESLPPDYLVHSCNPSGVASIHAFMYSWKLSRKR